LSQSHLRWRHSLAFALTKNRVELESYSCNGRVIDSDADRMIPDEHPGMLCRCRRDTRSTESPSSCQRHNYAAAPFRRLSADRLLRQTTDTARYCRRAMFRYRSTLVRLRRAALPRCGVSAWWVYEANKTYSERTTSRPPAWSQQVFRAVHVITVRTESMDRRDVTIRLMELSIAENAYSFNDHPRCRDVPLCLCLMFDKLENACTTQYSKISVAPTSP